MDRDIVADLSRYLPIAGRRRRAILRELQTHVDETRRELELSGWRPEDAARESVRRLGDPEEIAANFSQVYHRSRRKRVGLAFGLAGALLLGVYGASGTLASATSTHHPPSHLRAAQTQHRCTHHG